MTLLTTTWPLFRDWLGDDCWWGGICETTVENYMCSPQVPVGSLAVCMSFSDIAGGICTIMLKDQDDDANPFAHVFLTNGKYISDQYHHPTYHSDSLVTMISQFIVEHYLKYVEKFEAPITYLPVPPHLKKQRDKQNKYITGDHLVAQWQQLVVAPGLRYPTLSVFNAATLFRDVCLDASEAACPALLANYDIRRYGYVCSVVCWNHIYNIRYHTTGCFTEMSNIRHNSLQAMFSFIFEHSGCTHFLTGGPQPYSLAAWCRHAIVTNDVSMQSLPKSLRAYCHEYMIYNQTGWRIPRVQEKGGVVPIEATPTCPR